MTANFVTVALPTEIRYRCANNHAFTSQPLAFTIGAQFGSTAPPVSSGPLCPVCLVDFLRTNFPAVPLDGTTDAA